VRNRFWYVTDHGNAASVRLASACGFAPAGTGDRARPLGVSALAAFALIPALRVGRRRAREKRTRCLRPVDLSLQVNT